MVVWLAVVQVPLPFSLPHLSSPVSHTAAWQTKLPAPTVHLPFSVGFVCGTSTGMVVPLASFGVQTWLASLHHWLLVQSASTLQPPAGRHSKFALQLPERHTVAAVPAEHGPPLTA